MGNWNTGSGSANESADYAAMEDAYDAEMGYDTGPDLSTNVGGGGGDSRNEVDDTGGYSLTYEQARTAGVPVGPSGSTADSMGMAALAAEANRATGGAINAANVNAAVAAMNAGLTGGDGSGYRGAYTLPTATGPITMPAPIVSRSPVSIANPNYRPLARDYTQADLDRARAEYDRARSDAYSEKQFGFDFGRLGGPFGMYERIADALLDPEAALANQMAERGYATLNGYGVPSNVANYNPMGLNLATAGGPLSQGGRTAAYDPQTNSVYDSSPFSGLNPFGDGVPQNIQDLYDRRNQVEAEQRAREGGSDQPLIIPQEVAEVDPVTGEPTAFPDFTPRQFEYEPYVGKFYTIPSRFTKPYGLLG